MPTLASLAALVAVDNPLYMTGGLPVHTLVVHFAVVMLPLSAIALIAIILVPKWRGAFVWATIVGLIIGTGAAIISKASGEQLAERIGLPVTHAKWGDLLPVIAILLIVTAAVWLWLERRATRRDPSSATRIGSGPQLAVGIIALGLAVITIGMTIVVGHTGASAVWASRSLDSEAEEDAPVALPSASGSAAPSASAVPGVATYTLADVAGHATAADCWSAVNGLVYDLTAWIPQHPGGSGVIEAMCGVDGSAQFDGQHKGQHEANSTLAGFILGALGTTSSGVAPSTAAGASAAPASSPAAASAAGGYTLADVAAHATATDCWSAVNGGVYDLTAWIPQHPGGSGVIEAMCGIDGSAQFDGQHKGQGSPATALADYRIGALA